MSDFEEIIRFLKNPKVLYLGFSSKKAVKSCKIVDFYQKASMPTKYAKYSNPMGIDPCRTETPFKSHQISFHLGQQVNNNACKIFE